MSLHALANHMASKGRNGDSVLVHMTPGEVHGLQALAMKHGGSLTINPNTGLPEANFLKSLLPMLAGFALGPAGFGLVSSALGAGAIVGGITGIATGSLSKGLMAGLGAYGGFGIGEALTGAGADAMTRGALSVEGALPSIENITQVTGEGYGGSAANYSDQVNSAVKAARDASAAMPTSELLSAGSKAAMDDPMAFAKQNWKPIAAAALPVLSAIGTTTPGSAPTPTAPGRIVEKRWDGRQFVPVASTDAGVFNSSGRTFSDFNRGYNDGGIVALADGGDVQHYVFGGDVKADLEKAYAANDVAKINEIASANKITAGDIGDTYKGFDTSGIKGLQLYTPPAAPTYTQYTPEQMGSFLSNPVNKDIDIGQATKDTNADPAAVNRYIASLTSPFVGSTDTTGGSGTLGIYNNMVAKGVDPTEYYNAAIANDPKYAGWTKDMLQKGYNLDKGAYALTDQIAKDKIAADPKLGYDKQWVKFMDDNKYTVDDMAQAFGLPKNEIAARVQKVRDANTTTNLVTKITGTGTGTTTVPIVDATQRTTSNVDTPTSISTANASALPVGVSGAGVTTINPNGTVTTRPDFSLEMRDVRNAYTKGGGSLGYTSPSFTNIDDFTKKYVTDRMSGDSLDAYNYLSGKGGAQYPVKSRVGQISRPYDEAVLGYPARGNLPYTYNKATGKMDVNPDYVAPGRDAAGNVTYTMSLNEIKNTLKDAPLSGQALYDWATTNNLSAQQIADATNQSLSSVYAQFRAGAKAAAAKKKTDAAAGETDTGSSNQPFQGAAAGGMMGYADGGITGNGQLNLNIPLNLGGAGGSNGYSAVGGGFGSSGGYQGQSNQNSVQQSGMPDFRNQMQGFDAQIQKLPSITAYNDYTKFLGDRQATADEKAQVEQLRQGIINDKGFMDLQSQMQGVSNKYQQQAMGSQSPGLQQRYAQQSPAMTKYAMGGISYSGGGLGSLGSYSDGGRLLKGPGDGVSDSIPATIGRKQQPARLADGEFVVPARIVSELGNGSTDAGAKKLYAMMDRVQRARGKTTGKNKVAANSRADKYLPA